MKAQKSIFITAPPEKVWPFLCEPEKILQWSITFRKFEYTSDQRGGVGTPIYIEEKAGGPLMKMNFQITEWKENQKVVLQMISGGMLKHYHQEWTIEPSEEGCTFTFMEEIQMPWGFIGKLIENMNRGSSEAFIDQMLSKLKSTVEG